MALAWRPIEVVYELDDPTGQNQQQNDLSLEGQFLAVVEFFDTLAPTVILGTKKFILLGTMTDAQVQAHINAYGQKVRDARTRANALRVHIGTTFLVP